MFEDILNPVDDNLLKLSNLLPEQVIGKNIFINSKSLGFPDIKDISIAIIGINEYRNSSFGSSKYQIDKFRVEFYSLFIGNWNFKIADLGDLPNGKEIEDSYFMVNKISIDLRKLNIVPIFIGGSHDLTSSIYKSFEKNNQWINITSVDNRFDFSKNEKLISGDSYMSSIIMHKPSYLFSYTNIGYQSYLNSQEEIDLIEKLFFDCYRLGDVLDNIKIIEPVFRESDIVTFDLKCLSAILTGNSKYSSPNGFDSRSICALSRYAGISDRVSVIGFFELFNFDLFHKLFAQIVWYFIEGFSCRFGEYPLYTGEGFNKFTVQLSDRDLIFHKSQKSKRWWVEIVIKSYIDNKIKSNTLLSCTYEDYLNACNDKLPERWIKASKRL